MSEQDYLDLADRVEAATGPDRELDAEIEIAVHGFPQTAYDKRNRHYPSDRLAFVNDWIGTHYTASLDAAMTLLGADWGYEQHRPADKKPRHYVELWWVPTFPGKTHSSGATPALALTAACLRAHGSRVGDGRGLNSVQVSDGEARG